jgi:hypothetical protein
MEGQESQVVFEDKELDARFQEMTEKGKKRRAFVAGLRELADWYEQAPHWMPEPNPRFEIDVFEYSNRDLPAFAHILGKCTKDTIASFFFLRRMFGPIIFNVNFARELVCERKVIRHIVPETTVPASEKQVIPEHEEEVVEWDCSKSIFADTSGKTKEK